MSLEVVIAGLVEVGDAGGQPDARRRAVVLRLVGPSVVDEPRPRTIPLIWAPAVVPGSPLGIDRELFLRLWPLLDR